MLMSESQGTDWTRSRAPPRNRGGRAPAGAKKRLQEEETDMETSPGPLLTLQEAQEIQSDQDGGRGGGGSLGDTFLAGSCQVLECHR